MGLTDKGYTRRTYNDILNENVQKAKELFGEDIDTSDLTPLGKFIRIIAYDQALAEEEIEAVYYSRFPNTASGQSLDRLLVFGGLTRNPASPSHYTVEVQGVAGYVVPLGFLVGTDTEVQFYCTQEAVIGDDGTCEIEVCCTEAGEIGNVSASAISVITNPDANVSAIQGKACISPALDEESDNDLRVRLKAAIQGAGSCNENSLRAALLRVPTVQFAAVVSNETDDTDEAGRPPHSFECYVRGGDLYAQEIAEAIFSKKPIGIKTTGDKSVSIIDESGTEQIIKYSPTKNIVVLVKADVRVLNTFPEDGVARIQKAVSDHINSLGIGKSLILSSIYGHIYGVTGVTEVSSLTLSTDGGSTYTSDNVEVNQFSLAVCGDVTVSVEAVV